MSTSKEKCPLDLTQSIEELLAWYSRERRPTVHRDRVMELYFTFHPRTAFLKTLRADAVVADIGAGDGSLSVFRKWPEPARNDLRLHAYSIEKGRLFDDFDSFEISDWNAAPPRFGNTRFDAVVCAHFIEHVQEPTSFVRWAVDSVRPGGRIYLEWPSPHSLDLPPLHAMKAAGMPLVISRFDDDATHRALPDRAAMIAAFEAHGFRIEAQGLVRLPWLEDEMIATFRDADDVFPLQAAFWSYTAWSQYLVIEAA
jgi:SAM-dependent methyltransferase